MSNIYIQEPPTNGKVLLKTSVGDIDIELWSRECPKACRNFVQLCMEGYYNGTIFHRVVKGFIVQGGDPKGDGTGGESIYGDPFKDEFHSRLRFARRGLIAMANSEKDDNGSQFFFTMGPTPELQNKHTLFGKVTGETVFNMLKLEDGMVDHNERPLYPQKIIKTEVLFNPFPDIVPRERKKEVKKDKEKLKEKGVKNFGLLSFGEEAEEDEEETTKFVQTNSGKGKSTHDVLDDPKLSKETIKIASNEESDIEECDTHEDKGKIEEKMKNIRNKLKGTKEHPKEDENELKKEDGSDSEEDYSLNTIEKEKKAKNEKKKEEIRQQIRSLKKEYMEEKKNRNKLLEKEIEKEIEKKATNQLMKEYVDEKEKYAHLKKQIPKKGTSREEFTLQLLSKFRNKLEKAKEQKSEKETEVNSEEAVESEIQSDEWLSHTLSFENSVPILAKDASTKGDDWYDVYDPRNPLNKRKRGEEKHSYNKKGRH